MAQRLRALTALAHDRRAHKQLQQQFQGICSSKQGFLALHVHGAHTYQQAKHPHMKNKMEVGWNGIRP